MTEKERQEAKNSLKEQMFQSMADTKYYIKKLGDLSFKGNPKNKEEAREKLSDLIYQKGSVNLVAGALGELQGCSAYEEETVKEGMWRTKYLGISQWFKGIADTDTIDRVGFTKRAFMEGFKMLARNSYLVPLILIFRKRFIRKAIISMANIYRVEGGLKSKVLKLENFCPVCQELIRAGLKMAERIQNKEKGVKEIDSLKEQVKDLVYCFAMFPQFSTTYRVYLQDILSEMDKEKFLKSPLTETLRLKRIFMFRIKSGIEKMEPLWRGIFLFVMFNKKLSKEFIRELDIEKTKMDKDDWYYVLRRNTYDFGGKELYARLVEAEVIDKEQGNLILGI